MSLIRQASVLILCALAVGSAYGTEDPDSCKANHAALDALHAEAPDRRAAAVEIEELFELNKSRRGKVAKSVSWNVAEQLIRMGFVRSIEPPASSRQFIFFGMSGTKYSSTHPPGAHPYAIAGQVDPCGTFILLRIDD